MDLTNFITNDKNELIARGSYKNILWFAILMTIPCVGLLTDSFANWKSFLSEHLYGGLALLGFTYGVTIWAWYKVFDQRIKLIINKNGLWHPKTKFISWTDIEYFDFREQKSPKAGTFHILEVRTRNRDKEYKIDITLYDKTYEQIHRSLKENSANYSVQDLGLETS